MNLKELILVRGLPGSGKTTLCNLLMDYFNLDITVCMFAADDYFVDELTDEYNFDATQLPAAHAQCLSRTRNAMSSEDEDIVIMVHNTFTKESELAPYLELAKEKGFKVTTLIVENRHGHESVHDVPKAALQRMEDRFSVKL